MQAAWGVLTRAQPDLLTSGLPTHTSSSLAMEAKPTANDRSLGDLLYADRSDVTTEEEWAQLVRSIAAGDQQALRATAAIASCSRSPCGSAATAR